MPNREIVGELMKSFRASRNQCSVTPPEPKVNHKQSKSSRSSNTYKKSPQELFIEKYYDLENNIDSFGTSDILYFFVQKASERGVKYVIANFAKDMTCAKKLLSNYTPREVCLMIEFLFESGQTYLDMRKTTPAILLTGWCNRIVADTQDYLDGTFKSSTRPIREYDGDDDEESTIGVWE